MPGFHIQVERNSSDACSLNYKQTPLSSTKTNIYIYVCIYVYIYINLVVQKSTPGIKAAELAFSRAQLGSWLTEAPCPQDAEVSCAECSVPSAHGGQTEWSSPAWVKSLSGHLTSTQGRVHTSEHF